MKKLFLLTGFIILITSFRQETSPFPYQAAGLSKKQAAAHLLSRFSFGARPGEVDRVATEGLEKWFVEQLEARQNDDSLETALRAFPSLSMSNQEIVQTYPKPAQVIRAAQEEGRKLDISKDKKDKRNSIRSYMLEKGLKPQTELVRELVSQKILRAAYSNNQLKEVLTDFWFNHFNVSLTKGDDRQYITAYERDAIRPHVLGRFEDLLLATAKSPAMLTYLDNFRSVASKEPMFAAQPANDDLQMSMEDEKEDTLKVKGGIVRIMKARQSQGLNENYAREIMELHTLGVDGGYTQDDVTQAARILTGWTIFPSGPYAKQANRLIERLGEEKLQKQGFVREGDFFFAANKHDKESKSVLGINYPAGGGYEEGLKLIHELANHSSTARFISRKLAVRFVSDNPPASLVDKMATEFTRSGGDIKKILLTMVSSPEFWSKEAVREKTKSPFELAISSVRALNATIDAPNALNSWITKMGQQVYYYQAPTGFPDKGAYWINTGSLLNRMNFGLALAAGRIPGIRTNLAALNGNREPESAEAALISFSRILLPERDLTATVKRLQPMLADPSLDQKLEAATRSQARTEENMDEAEEMPLKKRKQKNKVQPEGPPVNPMLSQVVGIILGSPEFQRK